VLGAAFTVRMKTFFSLLLGAVLLCGCGGSDPGPAVSLINLRFEDATALETTATFTLRLSNESPQPVALEGEVHKIYLNGLYLGKGLSDAKVEVPRLGTVTHEVKVHLSNLALATRIKSIIETKSFEYRIVSVFHGKSMFRRMKSESSGKLELKDLVPDMDSTNAPTALPAAATSP
jgi:LEA14-like dessication related protein